MQARPVAWSIALAAALALARPAAPARAATFTFDDQAFGTATPLVITDDGLAATFTASVPGGFGITGNTLTGAPGLYPGLSGQILASPGTDPVTGFPAADGSVLSIAFSAPVSAVSLAFGLDGLAANTLSLVTSAGGTTSVAGIDTAGSLNAGGTLAFAGTAFTSLTLSSTAVDFAIDTLVTTPAGGGAVPEPSTTAALASGLLGLAAMARRRGG